MGAAGGSFGQAFVNTLMHGQQIIQANQDRQEELTLRKKMVQAQLQEHEAKMALQTRQAETFAGLRERLQPQWGEEEGAGMQQAAPLSDNEKMLFAAGFDPHEAAKGLLAGNVSEPDLEGIAAKFMNGGAQPSQPAAPAQQATQPSVAEPAPPPPPPGPAPEGGGPLPIQPGQTTGPRMKQEKSVGLSIGSDGKRRLELKVGEKTVGTKIDEVPVELPDGRTQLYRIVSDPDTGTVLAQVPVGSPKHPEQLVKYAAAARGWGLKPGTEYFEQAVADLAAADTTFTGRALEIEKEKLATYYRSVATARPKSTAPPQMPTDSPRKLAEAEEERIARKKAGLEVETAGKRTLVEGQARTEVEQQKPIGEDATRFVNIHTLRTADPSRPRRDVENDKSYVQVAPQQAQGMAYYSTIKQMLDSLDDIVVSSPNLFPPSTGDSAKDVGAVLAAQGKAWAQSKTNPTIGRLQTAKSTLPGVVKTFGDTANVAVAERGITEEAVPLTPKTRESALAQIDQLREYLNASTARYNLPPLKRKSGPKPKAVEEVPQGTPQFDWDDVNKRRIPRKP